MEVPTQSEVDELNDKVRTLEEMVQDLVGLLFHLPEAYEGQPRDNDAYTKKYNNNLLDVLKDGKYERF